jgi:hypothetical protein
MPLREQVLDCLLNFPDTRNSDIKLTNSIWYKYYPDKIQKNDNGELVVRLLDLYDLPREDNVKRIRATIQNDEGKFLPTDKEVIKQRRINEEKWRKELGYC